MRINDYLRRHVCEINLEVSTPIPITTSGRRLKKDFGDLRRKQEKWLDEYLYKPFRYPSTLTSYKEQKI